MVVPPIEAQPAKLDDWQEPAYRRQPEPTRDHYGQIDQIDPVERRSTAERLAEKHGVSAPTIKRDGRFAASVEGLKTYIPDIEQKAMSGEVKRAEAANERRGGATGKLQGNVVLTTKLLEDFAAS